MAPESRAEYFKERRTKFKMFSVEISREKMERLEAKLAERNEKKAEWLNRKINEELDETK